MSKNFSEGHEYYVNELRKAGETIIKNARSLVGEEPGLCDMVVSIRLTPNDVTIINVDKNLYTDRDVDALSENSGFDDHQEDL